MASATTSPACLTVRCHPSMAARPVSMADPGSCGVGQINAVKSGFETSVTANPNAGLNRFVVSASGGSDRTFDAVSWNEAARSDVSWNEVSWNEVSWNEVSWNEVSWNEGSQEDAAEGDSLDLNGYELTWSQWLAASSDPDLAVPTG